MKLRKLLALILALCMLFALGACSAEKDTEPESAESVTPAAEPETEPEAESVPTEKTAVNVGMLKGPTGIGSVYLMQASDAGTTANDYTFTLAAAPDELTGAIVSGDVDIAALPTNVAASLYNKTEGGITMLALNTLGVLYILENGNSVASLADLSGRTLYATGQGSNPQYVLEYLLRQNGLEPGADVNIEYMASDELATLMAAGQAELCMLPVPNATSVVMKNSDVRMAIDLTAEWDALNNGSVLTMGCVVVRNEFLAENKEAVDKFIEEYFASITAVIEQPDDVYALIAAYELVGSEQVAKAALGDCNLTYIAGNDLANAIGGYYQVLFDADPTSIGGAIPDEAFYYTGYEGDDTLAKDACWGY